MYNYDLTHFVFPDLQDYDAHGNKYTAAFTNDKTLCIHNAVETPKELYQSIKDSLTDGNYILWVDDITSPFDNSTKSQLVIKEDTIIVVARCLRSAWYVMEEHGNPKRLYLDHNLDTWKPIGTGNEVIYMIASDLGDGVSQHTPVMIPISSEKDYNQQLLTTWKELIPEEFVSVK